MNATLVAALSTLLLAGTLAGCGRADGDGAKTREQQRAEREAYEKKREERAMQNPGQMFDQAQKRQERAAAKAEAQRRKLGDEALKRQEQERNEASKP